MVFQNELPQPVVTLIRAEKLSAEWRIRYKITQSIQSPTPPMSTRHPKKTFWVACKKPPQGFIKINSDGSKSDHQASGGYVIRNWTGQFIQAGTFNLGAASILVAKATTMHTGLRAAIAAGFLDLHIKADNKVLIQAVQGQS